MKYNNLEKAWRLGENLSRLLFWKYFINLMEFVPVLLVMRGCEDANIQVEGYIKFMKTEGGISK